MALLIHAIWLVDIAPSPEQKIMDVMGPHLPQRPRGAGNSSTGSASMQSRFEGTVVFPEEHEQNEQAPGRLVLGEDFPARPGVEVKVS